MTSPLNKTCNTFYTCNWLHFCHVFPLRVNFKFFCGETNIYDYLNDMFSYCLPRLVAILKIIYKPYLL